MNYKKLQDVLRMCIYLMAIFGVMYLTGRLVYQYIRYAQENQAGEDVGSEKQLQEGKTVGNDEQIQAREYVGDNEWVQISETIENDGENETEAAAGNEKENETEEFAGNEKQNETGEIAGKDKQKDIRVQLLSGNYKSRYHTEVTVTSDTAFQVIWNRADENGETAEAQKKTYEAGACFGVTAAEMGEDDEICIQTGKLYQSEEKGNTGSDQGSSMEDDSSELDRTLRITSFTRADGYPEYCGKLYLYRDENGMILVNELPIETYLYSVVSSEIPSGYPLEAQMAQAVCARTYALKCMGRARESGALADLDDSVSWQVYNNYRSSEISREAVDLTAGEMLETEEALYYSTSCLSEHCEELDTDEAFAAFLKEVPNEEAEYGSPWVRWNTAIDSQTILNNLLQKYDFAADGIDQILVTERSGNGQVQKIKIVCGDRKIEIEGEYQIRNVLSPENTVIRLLDGSEVEQMRMLPSAYFIVDHNESNAVNSAGEDETDNKVEDTDRITGEMDTETEGYDVIHSGYAETESEVLEDSVKVVYISGGGYGHGIGMSQCGAAAMAAAGADYREILEYYYGAELFQGYER